MAVGSSARSKARKRALDVLFESEVQGTAPTDALAALERRQEQPLNEYVRVLVEGVDDHRERIDELLATYSSGWTLDRMPAVDRNVLRIGTWELLWGQVPDAVAISEAVVLVTDLSTDDSPAFINGVLGRILDIREHLVLDT
ncbi:MAG: transcription antitermination factor NusB [Actinomycetes bacterium]